MKKQIKCIIQSKWCLPILLAVFTVTLPGQDFAVDGIEYGITSTSPAEVEVVGYTGSATVNGDGANDPWSIDNLSENVSMRIYDLHSTIFLVQVMDISIPGMVPLVEGHYPLDPTYTLYLV